MSHVVEQRHTACGGRERPFGLDVVLEQNRIAVEQPARLTSAVDGARLIQRGGIEGDDSVDLRIHSMHPREGRLGRSLSTASRSRSSRQHGKR